MPHYVLKDGQGRLHVCAAENFVPDGAICEAPKGATTEDGEILTLIEDEKGRVTVVCDPEKAAKREQARADMKAALEVQRKEDMEALENIEMIDDPHALRAVRVLARRLGLVP